MPAKPNIGVNTASITQLDLFHPERLTAASFEAAVAAFGRAILSAGSCDAVLLDLLSQPLWVEVALSGEGSCGHLRLHITDRARRSAVPDHIFSVFQTCLLGQFPGNAAAFDVSLAARLIQRISMSLFILPCGRSSDTLLERNREVSLLTLALLALPKFGFGTPASPSSPEDEFDLFVVRQKSRKANRRERSMSIQAPPDPTIFERTGLYYPDTKEDVEDLEGHILGRMCTILGVSGLRVFRHQSTLIAVRRSIWTSFAGPSSLKPSKRRISQ
jgi:hypothetical protein